MCGDMAREIYSLMVRIREENGKNRSMAIFMDMQIRGEPMTMAELLAVLGFIVALALIAAVLAGYGVLRVSVGKPRPRTGGGNG